MRTLRNLCPRLAALTLLLAWLSTSGCAGPRIVPADRVVLPVKAGVPFTAALDGVFLSDALWQDTQRALEDKILELKTEKPK